MSLQRVCVKVLDVGLPARAKRVAARRRRNRFLDALAALLLLTLSGRLLAACSPTASPRLVVSPTSAFFATPFTATVDGAAPGATVELQLAMRSSNGGVWSSEASFRADRHGEASTTRAPIAGDYRGVRRMGLVEALHPESGSPDAFTLATIDRPATMTVTAVIDHRTIGRATLHRRFCDAVATTRELTVQADGVDGVLAEPLHPSGTAEPAVLIMGGSQGGYAGAPLACEVASLGFPALEIAYFDAPGLPATAARLPLEYLRHAAEVLAKQPHVDRDRIVAWGISLGSQGALLTAANYPKVVYAAVGTTPFSTATGGAPDTSIPLWTIDGRDVRPAAFGATASPTQTGAIPVEDIAGPILLACGGEDQVIDSCANAHAIQQRLTLEHARPATLLEYPKAGHSLNTFGAYIPVGTTIPSIGGVSLASGGTLLDDAEARDDGWAALAHWLQQLRR